MSGVCPRVRFPFLSRLRQNYLGDVFRTWCRKVITDMCISWTTVELAYILLHALIQLYVLSTCCPSVYSSACTHTPFVLVCSTCTHTTVVLACILLPLVSSCMLGTLCTLFSHKGAWYCLSSSHHHYYPSYPAPPFPISFSTPVHASHFSSPLSPWAS